ncbi:isoprenoid synthase domain-containing protein [Suillus plorans]|uniref:Terpene synthase n=1 Tax=Suillus plorans TaxID=116603 RepID=A0A9P7DGK5_9AGAM|nr:isoprenoid synthase domain-containing protein [Suillus plorans]KAG1793407.1 isoprenoid synthase domain-containing protein [Suillus plorans]
MDARPKTIYLPDTMVNWPWPRTINPHYEDVKAEVNASFRDFKALSPNSQEAFNKCDFEHFRIACDLMNLFFIYDEYTDFENDALTKNMADIVFWARAIKSASLSSKRHFLETFPAYLYSVLQLRCKTVGVIPSFPILEMAIDFPDEVLYHPIIMDLAECITDLVLIDNDMISYNKEQVVGNKAHSIISTIMFDLGLDVSGAMAWAAHYHTEVQKRFIDGLAKVPSWGPSIDVLVKEYLDKTAMWARGNHSWSYESQRYLATMGPEIQQNRLVPLLPSPKCRSM